MSPFLAFTRKVLSSSCRQFRPIDHLLLVFLLLLAGYALGKNGVTCSQVSWFACRLLLIVAGNFFTCVASIGGLISIPRELPAWLDKTDNR